MSRTNSRARKSRIGDRLQVPVASRNLVAQHRIRAGDLASSELAQTTPDAIATTEAIVNRYLRVAKEKGRPFLATDLSETPVLKYNVSLISLSIPASRALNGLLEPGLLVDIYGTVKDQDKTSSVRLVWDLTLESVIDGTGSDPASILVLSLPTSSKQAIARLADLTAATNLFIASRPSETSKSVPPPSPETPPAAGAMPGAAAKPAAG
jgi:hypothetical protein